MTTTTPFQGGIGNDTITGIDLELNFMDGAGGDDILDGGAADDILFGGDGNDSLLGGANDDILVGDIGDDNLFGETGIDNLSGGVGNDTLNGGTEADVMIGGAGDDTFIVDDAVDLTKELFGGGTDLVQTTISYTLSDNMENMVASGLSSIDVTGNDLGNALAGNGGNNILDGKIGVDTLSGNAGNDTYVIDNAGDRILSEEIAGNGTADTVLSSVAFRLSTGLENLTLTGARALSGTGDAANNIIVGNSGANILAGGNGNDKLDGGVGKDKLSGGNGNDILVGGAGIDSLVGGKGRDTFLFNVTASKFNIENIRDFSHRDDSIQLDRSVLKGIGNVGKLKEAAFRLGPKALDSSDRIIYDPTNGNLFHDRDGVGSKFAAIKIGIVVNEQSAKVALNDFLIVA